MTLLRMLKNFGANESGAVLPLLGIGLAAVVGVAGLGVDSARSQMVQSKLTAAIDAAGLAAGANISTTNAKAEVEKYVHSNFPPAYLGAKITWVDVQVSTDNSVIKVSATADVPTTFMNAFGFSKLTVEANNEIKRTNKGLELAMVLDNTGSMSDDMDTLKSAANELLKSLYGSRTSIDNLYIGLVPFSQGVNIGSHRTSWIDTAYKDSLHWGLTSWGGCVMARVASGRDKTEDTPDKEKFKAYYWPDDDDNNNWITNAKKIDDLKDDEYAGNIGATIGPNKNCPTEITPLTRNRATIESAISAMQARGVTHINDGAVWGWYMLSPDWRDKWGGEMDTLKLPLNYGTKLMVKAMVLMTDGDNVINDDARGSYGYLYEGLLGTTDRGTAEKRLDDRLKTVCKNMKNKGVLIYAVGFGSMSNSTLKMLRDNCASQPDYYFHATNKDALTTAFKQIGDSLANLRVSR